jgi:hypothetical protein
LTWSVPSEGYCTNAYMMWGFWCDCWPSQFTFFFHYYHSHIIGE